MIAFCTKSPKRTLITFFSLLVSASCHSRPYHLRWDGSNYEKLEKIFRENNATVKN